MKKTILTILSAVLMFNGLQANAQGKYGADSAECIKYLSYYKEYFKQKSYDDALPNWRQAYKLCPPSCSQNMIVDGTTLLRRLISKNSRNAEYRNALVDSLLTLHDLRAQYFPKYALTALNNKGLDMSNYIKNNPDKLFSGYEQIIENNAADTKSTIFLFDLNSAIELFQNGTVDAEQIIKIYQRNLALLEQAPAKSEAEAAQNAKVKADLENLFISSKVASCENLIALFEPRFEANPNDLALSTNIVKMMSMTEGCNDNDLYLKAVTTMYTLDPSASSAYYLYKLHSARDNEAEAIKYIEEAIASEDTDQATDAAYNYELAAYCYKHGRNAKAYEVASKVPALDEAWAGKAYFLMGTIWGTTTCGGDEVARRSPYWVACDYMNKAKAADPSLTEEAGRYISNYSRYFPQAADAFMYGVENGQSYTVVCGGMRATTVVRTVK